MTVTRGVREQETRARGAAVARPAGFGSGWWTYAILTALCLTLYLPGIGTIPPIDRDEARFAQATKQMIETGDFIRPRFQAADRFNKPPGIYWLQALAVQLSGRRRDVIWPYRVPSVLAAIAAVLLTYRLGLQLFERRTARLGAALLAASALLTVEAHLATTDAVLLACTVWAQGCLARLYAAGRRGEVATGRHALGFWVAQGVGILVKGPVVPLVSGLTAGALYVLDRVAGPDHDVCNSRLWFRALRAHWGVPLLLGIVLPWAIAAGWATHGAFFHQWFGHDIAAKIVGEQESHGAPPGFYLVLAAATFWPGSFAAGLGVVRGVRRRTRIGERFCLAWLVPTWIFFEAMPTKLPHYVLPLYPALALLTARAVLAATSAGRVRARLLRAGFVLWAVLTVAVCVTVLLGTNMLGNGVSFVSLITAIAVAASALLGVGLCWYNRFPHAAWCAVASSVVLFVPLLQWIVPDLRALWLSPAASLAVQQERNESLKSRPLGAVGYHEPSLVFLVDGDVALVETDEVATFLKEQPDGLVLVSDDQRDNFMAAASEIGVRPRELWSIEGLNYSKGRRTRLRLFDQPPLAPAPAAAAAK